MRVSNGVLLAKAYTNLKDTAKAEECVTDEVTRVVVKLVSYNLNQ